MFIFHLILVGILSILLLSIKNGGGGRGFFLTDKILCDKSYLLQQSLNFHSYHFWGGRLKFVFRYHFLQGTELSKIKSQGIYESDNHLFQGIIVFKNLVVHTPVWIKNGITQCMGLVTKSLLAHLMMMILNWNKNGLQYLNLSTNFYLTKWKFVLGKMK